jgi:ribonuclease HII
MMELLVAGVDEAGRGPLAGPVVAAAVILDPMRPITGIDDSKRLGVRRRITLAQRIREESLAWALGRAEAVEIDALNILEATMLAMQRAVAALDRVPDRILVDGNRLPRFDVPAEAVVGGDGTVTAIGAASILAKTARDAEMVTLDREFPEWGFAVHKGYPTRAHLDALARHGVCPCHRRSFAPVRRCIEDAVS